MTQTARFIHRATDKSNKPLRLRYTAAYSFTKDADGVLNVAFGIAQCSRGDTFSRSSGRALAEARLNKALSGKTAKLRNEQGSATPAMYGTLVVRDAEGLNVGKFVSENYEAERRQALQYNSGFIHVTEDDVNLLKSLGLIR